MPRNRAQRLVEKLSALQSNPDFSNFFRRNTSQSLAGHPGNARRLIFGLDILQNTIGYSGDDYPRYDKYYCGIVFVSPGPSARFAKFVWYALLHRRVPGRYHSFYSNLYYNS